ncbi:S8 family serine peptidase [Microbacterium sp. NPDC007973]|uniref:S8 family peptidase n=1 Tax=Microbacterium sp. NPDC007973 TaxID=3364182 RepID=UPI0036EA8C45
MTRRSRTLRALAAAAVTSALAVVGVAPAAQAAAGGDYDWWYDTYQVQAAHDSGITGAGVKIAVIDTQIDPDLPIFEGRNLTVSNTQICKSRTEPVSDAATDQSIHGTTMAALLIGNGTGASGIRGMAPDADVTFYGYGTLDSRQEEYCRPNTDDDVTMFGYAVKKAVDEGAKIITTSVQMRAYVNDAPAIAYALARGVTIVVGTPNADTPVDSGTDVASFNGVVAASAINRHSDLQRDAAGNLFVIPDTDVVAAGVDLPTVGTDGNWDSTRAAVGSSFAAPMVAGMLALAAQKYPAATGNQLVQSMIATTTGEQREPTRTDDGYGYGAAWLPGLLSVDPTTFPDEPPLMSKPLGTPTLDQIDTAETQGFVPVTVPRSMDQYGDTGSPSSGFDIASLVIWIVIGIGILLVVAAVVIVLIVVAQRRKAGKGNTP